MRFLGTSAGEGIPNPFCNCRVCENARKVGGKEIRTRSSFRLSDKVMIDMGGDFHAQSVFYGENFSGVRHVLYTHTHDDHFNYTAFTARSVRRDNEKAHLKAYFTGEAMDVIDELYLKEKYTYFGTFAKDNIEFVKLDFLKSSKIDEFTVTPFRGMHSTPYEKNSANYLIEKSGMKLYYALDSGYFPDETFEALKNKELDIFIGELTLPDVLCTPEQQKENVSEIHMNTYSCLKNLDKLYKNKTITDNTKVYLSHIGPLASHVDIEKYFSSLDLPYKIMVAYDGLYI